MPEVTKSPEDQLEIVRIADRTTNIAKAMEEVVSKMRNVVNLAKGTEPPSETRDKPARTGAYGEIEDGLDSIRDSSAVIEECLAEL